MTEEQVTSMKQDRKQHLANNNIEDQALKLFSSNLLLLCGCHF